MAGNEDSWLPFFLPGDSWIDRIRAMKAIQIHEFGGPEVLRWEEIPDPTPTEEEVLLEVKAASINHLDIWIRKGLPGVKLPRILGCDAAGISE